jgi:DNA-binding transcriptional ArsR family regulator
MDVEELMGSRGRIRVLRVLSESRELNISEVGRRTGMNYTSVERHLEALSEMGLLREKRQGEALRQDTDLRGHLQVDQHPVREEQGRQDRDRGSQPVVGHHSDAFIIIHQPRIGDVQPRPKFRGRA